MEDLDATLRPLTQGETLGEQAYFTIRNAITSGVLKPGERIKERDLARRLEISTTPIREALRQLEQEGLVVRKPNQGVSVSDMPLASIEEIVLIQAALRGVAARLAADKITEAEIAEIQAVLRESRERLDTGDAEKLIALSDRFHALVNEASRNKILLRFLDTIMAFDRRHRLQSLRDRDQIRPGLAEHEEIAAALTARDRDRAEALMRSHVLRAGQLLFKGLPDA